ncbi:MAG TPA: DNA-directed RNA polymerase subunit L [Methanothermococcus okinawensis]|uniref:DNA-directed RNA polymerase subunit Rpo11 n=1 Tax=Methanothermococcus okinawensis TaxID=155863 RepID=A0A832ZB08_9EURY|nr:DNA-directed RNA polymerase subunit L [Methanococcaceae archaeon]HIP84101.1 DNA-directed RNA polymerase subunit L [Methanothermococcus okinawensis]HIP91647.1 DNA-directed RNA polymerase subunit L [Methanothermococcus okinawensis]
MGEYVKILNRDKNSIELEIVNEDHSLCNLLKDILLKKEDKVVMASYCIEHPVLDPETGRYISNPKITLITREGVDPLEVLKEALREIVELCDRALEDLR